MTTETFLTRQDVLRTLTDLLRASNAADADNPLLLPPGWSGSRHPVWQGLRAAVIDLAGEEGWRYFVETGETPIALPSPRTYTRTDEGA